MSFTDQKPRAATEQDLKARWGGHGPGERFRCYLCGHKFKVGDIWRWVFANGRTIKNGNVIRGLCNFITCENCDGDDVLNRWVRANEELYQRFWWAQDH